MTAKRAKSIPVEVTLRIAGIPLVAEGVSIDGRRPIWCGLRSSRTGMRYGPEFLGLKGWLDVELRAAAEYRGQEHPAANATC